MEYLKTSEFLVQFGANLKKIRKSKGFTQAELANDIGIEISQISRVERGIINTSASTIYEISKALNIHITDLFNLIKKVDKLTDKFDRLLQINMISILI